MKIRKSNLTFCISTTLVLGVGDGGTEYRITNHPGKASSLLLKLEEGPYIMREGRKAQGEQKS